MSQGTPNRHAGAVHARFSPRLFYAPAMRMLATSAHAAAVDPVARTVAIAGVVLALASFLFTWYQWRRSGASLKVVVSAHGGGSVGLENRQPPKWVVTVEVLNTGRMSAVIRDITVSQLANPWALTSWVYLLPKMFGRGLALGKNAKPLYGQFPQAVPPTGYIQARATLDANVMDASCRWLRATVWRGDGRTVKSPVILTPRDEHIPRALRKMLQASREAMAMDDDE